MLPGKLRVAVEDVLTSKLKSPVNINRISAVAGGSINKSVQLTTDNGDYFLKYNDASRYPGMFETESRGLKLLSQVNAVRVPDPVATGISENTSWLLLHFIHPGKRNKEYYETLGRQLAALHRNTASAFGLDHDNYIGSLPQTNKLTVSGYEFMITQRFQPLVKMAGDARLLSATEVSKFDSLYKKLPDLIPEESPALLHGDLWNGNVIPGSDGTAWLIDPAVYFGYRETDLAMSLLFGGFESVFYDAYHETFALQTGWQNRIGLFQLYPLLVHLNLFGSGYRSALLTELQRLL